jgi:hypothetical protein
MRFSRPQLIEDARELLGWIDAIHPDPYRNAGGKVAFHRTFHYLLSAIPAEGMTKNHFWWHLAPLVAAVGDGHTYLIPVEKLGPDAECAVPLKLSVLSEAGLMVTGVTEESDSHLIGARLLSVHGVKIPELIHRSQQLFGMENELDDLRSVRGMLWIRSYFVHLVPEWDGKSEIEVELLRDDGTVQRRSFASRSSRCTPIEIDQESKVTLPATDRVDFAFTFLDPERKTCLLRINKQNEHRELVEQGIEGMKTLVDAEERAKTHERYLELGKAWFRRFNEEEPSDDLNQIIAGIPSATEAFRDLVIAMREAATENLIVDLRTNRGGQSVLGDILIYMLFGTEKLKELTESTSEVAKLSEHLFHEIPWMDVDKISRDYAYPLTRQDYYFGTWETAAWSRDAGNLSGGLDSFRDSFKLWKTFYLEITSGDYAGYYKPENIVVISGENTYSSGFELMAKLYKAGAVIVGTPSAQAGNCFGMSIEPGGGLKNTGLRVRIATKLVETFPNDRETGEVLMPAHLLSYESLRQYGFDPNSAVLLALDSLQGRAQQD